MSRPVEEGGQTFVDVTDPDTGNTFRFYEVEYAVACAMDGRRDLEGLVSWSREELGVEPTPDELELIVNTLEDLGYLSGIPATFIAGMAGQAAASGPAMPDSMPAHAPVSVTPPAVIKKPAADHANDDIPLGLAGAAPKPRTAPAVSQDFELGLAGGAAPEEHPHRGTSSRDDIELGLAGASSRSASVPSAAYDEPRTEVELDVTAVERAVAPPRREDVSTDLSNHLDIGTDDVKEAVRQSRVMSAVAMADDDDEPDVTEVDMSRGPEPMELPPPRRAVTPVPAPVSNAMSHAATMVSPALSVPAPPPAAATQRRASEQRPVAPAPAAAPARAPVAAPPPAMASADAEVRPSGTRTILFVVLVVLLGGFAFYYYWEYLREPEAPAAQAPAQPAAKQEAKPPAQPPAKPELPTATMRAGEPMVHELRAAAAGKIEWLAAAGAEVEQGAPIAKLGGWASAEKKVLDAEKSRQGYQDKLDKANAAGDRGAAAAAEADVKRKEADIEAAKESLAKVEIMAPMAGTVEPIAKVGDRVAVDAPVARLTHAGRPQATFELPADAARREVGAKVKLRDKTDADAPPVECEVSKLEGAALTVTCPPDTNLTDGTAVTLE